MTEFDMGKTRQRKGEVNWGRVSTGKRKMMQGGGRKGNEGNSITKKVKRKGKIRGRYGRRRKEGSGGGTRKGKRGRNGRRGMRIGM